MQIMQYVSIPLLLLFLGGLPYLATRWIASRALASRFFSAGVALGTAVFLALTLPNVALTLLDHIKEAGIGSVFTLYYGLAVTGLAGIVGAVVGYYRRSVRGNFNNSSKWHSN